MRQAFFHIRRPPTCSMGSWKPLTCCTKKECRGFLRAISGTRKRRDGPYADGGLEILCRDPKYYSGTVTAILMPPGHDSDAFRKVVLDNFDMSLGAGLSKLAGKVFRIGHLGECNEFTLLGALAGVEMSLSLADVPHQRGGVLAAIRR